MDIPAFYLAMFDALEAAFGSPDPDTITGLIGFDAGGPLSLSTFGRDKETEFSTYVSCELAVRDDQKPASFGRYELMMSCNSLEFVRTTLSAVGRMTFGTAFDHNHTLDIGSWVPADEDIQGLVFEPVVATEIAGHRCGVMRLIGVTRRELGFAVRRGVPELIRRLQAAEVYPHTDVCRQSIV